MCVCSISALNACGKKEEQKIVQEDESIEANKEDESTTDESDNQDNAEINESADIVTVTLYSYDTDSYYKVNVDKSEVYEYAMAQTTGEETYEELEVWDNNINEIDLYCNVESHKDDGIEYNVFSANRRYVDEINEKKYRHENDLGIPPRYNGECTDYLNVYKYNEIEYTVLYSKGGDLDVFIKNPYNNIYDLKVHRSDIGIANEGYLKIADELIDSVEFVEP